MPKAVIHKKILDTARDKPDASIRQLAADVTGASEQLVEQTLDKYGDPASDGDETDTEDAENTTDIKDDGDHAQATNAQKAGDENMETTNSTESTGSTANSQNDVASNFEDATQSSSNHTEDIGDNGSEIEKTETNPSQTQTSTDEVSLEELTEKQRQILQAVCERPHATQAELAELFDVSRATISQRVNAIDNFEWSNRKEFVDSLFDDEDVIQHRTDHAVSFDQVTTHIEKLSNRIDELEQTIENKSEASGTPFNDPEIAATVVRACIDSECVDEDQEQEIIVKLIGSK